MASNFSWMSGQSWCKSSVSKHGRIRLSLLFPVCAPVDLVHQSSATGTYSLNIVHAEKATEQALIGKQKVNGFFGEVLLLALPRLRNHNATDDGNLDFRSFRKILRSRLGKLM